MATTLGSCSVVPVWLRSTALAGVVVVALVSVINLTGLYGDGAYYLVRLISGEPFLFTYREPSSFLRHLPALGAIQMGVTSNASLSLLQSAGYLVPPAVLWSYSLILSADSRRRFILILYTCFITISTTWLFSVSELILGIPCVYVLSLLLTRNEALKRSDLALGVVASALLVTVHEALMVCSLIILGQLYIRKRLFPEYAETGFRIFIVVASVLNIAWSIFALIQNYGRTGSYFLGSIIDLSPQPFVLLVLVSLLPPVAYVIFSTARLKQGFLPFVVTVIFVLVAGVMARNFLNSPYFSYSGRAWIVLMAVAVQISLTMLFLIKKKSFFEKPPLKLRGYALYCLPAVFLLFLPTWQGFQFSASIRELKGELSTNINALLPVTGVLSDESGRYMWGWSNPSLSIVVRESSCSGILLPPLGWTPFEPLTAHKQIPPNYVWGTEPEASRYCQTP